MAPAAPRVCPVAPLVELVGGAFAPKSARSASASALSLAGVAVPWALT